MAEHALALLHRQHVAVAQGLGLAPPRPLAAPDPLDKPRRALGAQPRKQLLGGGGGGGLALQVQRVDLEPRGRGACPDRRAVAVIYVCAVLDGIVDLRRCRA